MLLPRGAWPSLDLILRAESIKKLSELERRVKAIKGKPRGRGWSRKRTAANRNGLQRGRSRETVKENGNKEKVIEPKMVTGEF